MKYKVWDNCIKDFRNNIIIDQNGNYFEIHTDKKLGITTISKYHENKLQIIKCSEEQDINSKDIYDGDLVKLVGDTCIYEVYYDEYKTAWFIKNKNEIHNLAGLSCEIVGNIYTEINTEVNKYETNKEKLFQHINKIFKDCKYCEHYFPHEEKVYGHWETFTCCNSEGEWGSYCDKFQLNSDFKDFIEKI